MKLFKGQIEVKETDTINVYQNWLEVVDKNGNITYFENSDEFWEKKEFDENGNMTYFENSDEFWSKREFDKNGKETYYETSSGYWIKTEYDDKGNTVYYENSDGKIIDNRLKEITIEELAELGYKLKEKR